MLTTNTVQVTARDSSGTATDPVFATVTINVFDVDEKPTFTCDVPNGERHGSYIVENVTGAELDIATYTATDPEGESVTLSLMGDDAGLFELADAGKQCQPDTLLQEEPGLRDAG